MSPKQKLRVPRFLGGGVSAQFDGKNVILEAWDESGNRVFMNPEAIEGFEKLAQEIRDVKSRKEFK